MKTKEAIRNELIRYAGFAWQTRDINRQHPLVQLMIEELCNEVYLLNSKLEDINYSVLEKLVKRLTPSTFGYIRPSHAILHLRPNEPEFILDKRTDFFVKDISPGFQEGGITSIIFTPVVDIRLIKAAITHLFFDNTLWSVNNAGKKEMLLQTDKKAKYNTLWLGLDIDKEVKSLENMAFYMQFPHLNDNHQYYDILSCIRWQANGRPLKVKQGFPLMEGTRLSKVEKEILDFYRDHYQAIENPIRPEEIARQKIPDDLALVVNEELSDAFPPPLHWISITFPPHFKPEDIARMRIRLNAFPAVNRHYNERKFSLQEINSEIALSSDTGEEFLEINSFTDTKENACSCVDIIKNAGEYSIEPIKKKEINDAGFADHLERLIDRMSEESAAFPQVDKDKVLNVYNSIAAIENEDGHKTVRNWLNEYADVARLTVRPKENITAIDISWWTTYAGRVNGIAEKNILMAHKNSRLNKSEATFLTGVDGGRSFYDFESLKAINRFYMTSHNRILTKHNILNFCKIELGKYMEDVDAVKVIGISHKQKEGLINVMEIRIKPRREHVEYLQKSRILKDLRIRLKQRSPDTFNYRIVLQEAD